MRMREITDRLQAEFPGRTVMMQTMISAYNSGSVSHEITMFWFDSEKECHSIRCRSMDEGIAAIHGIIDGADPHQDVPTDVMSMEVVA